MEPVKGAALDVPVTIRASVANVNAGIAKFSSVVQADTLIANSVVASSCTPGAGNVW